MKIKVCGLTNVDDVQLAVQLGADCCGFVMATSPRQVSWDALPSLCEATSASVLTVAVMVDPSSADVERALQIVDRVQLHGQESPEFCHRFGPRVWKAFRILGASDLERLEAYGDSVGAFLLDSFVAGVAGGTGKTFPWHHLTGRRFGRTTFLAGGLGCDNVADALRVEAVQGLDISSGIEISPGRKDSDKMRQFFELTTRK